ncbi:MAG: Peptidase, family [Myxococcales bacterium]|nr:Peptidase, family [Myxococcales bacterium]
MTSRKRRLSPLCIAVAVAGCWSTPRPAAPHRDTPIALDVEQVELPNGLRVVVVPEPASDEVSVSLRYGVGASDDPPGQEGTAHLVEHLMFEHVRGDEALFDYLETHALGFNGYTTLDATIYTEHAAPPQLGDLLELETARIEQACAAIPATSFARQREIVRNELRERDDSDRVHAALHDAVFAKGHPFAGRLATPDTIATVTQDQACAFAAAHYAPSNAVLVISGRVALADARPLIDRTLARLPRADIRPATIPPVAGRRQITVEAPVDRAWLVLAWPMPEGAAPRAQLRAVVSMTAALVDSRVNGIVTTLELGSGAARLIALAVAPSSDITMSDALAGIRDAISRMGPWFGSGLYEHEQSTAVHEFAASLDHSVDRDLAVAEDVAAGSNARASIDEVVHGLMSMSRSTAEDLMHSALDPDAATIVTLKPSRQASQIGGSLTTTFREARRRKSEDPADARRPAPSVAIDAQANPIRERTLANGLRVVLVPQSTMPTVDIRLVFPAGTADEPTAQRGVAMIAAEALSAPSDALRLRFVEAGGRIERKVELDHTELVVRGLAANLDLLLAGLDETVREGTYEAESARQVINWRNLTRRSDVSDRRANDVWRLALYGDDHPYRYAGQWIHADRAVTNLDAMRNFRAAHYRPAGATLIIAGRFDAADADRWIDYYFAEWTGAATPRHNNRPAVLRAMAFAQTRDTAQVSVNIAFSAPPAARIASLVATEMIDEAVADIREQLAASYGIHARLHEARLASTIELDGYVDAKRASEVFALLRDRLARLRDPSDETAALFVSARRHVLARLLSVDTRADALADRFVDYADIGADRDMAPASAEEARVLTIDRVAPFLRTLDFSNAAILLRGPQAAVAAAYAAIGRQPSLLE